MVKKMDIVLLGGLAVGGYILWQNRGYLTDKFNDFVDDFLPQLPTIPKYDPTRTTTVADSPAEETSEELEERRQQQFADTWSYLNQKDRNTDEGVVIWNGPDDKPVVKELPDNSAKIAQFRHDLANEYSNLKKDQLELRELVAARNNIANSMLAHTALAPGLSLLAQTLGLPLLTIINSIQGKETAHPDVALKKLDVNIKFLSDIINGRKDRIARLTDKINGLGG